MSRFARVVVPGLPHHITQRGNRRDDVFFDDSSRFSYLNIVRHYFRVYGVGAMAYCLMTNHVHFVAVPEQADSFAQAFRDAHATYSLSLNKRYGFTGHVWQGRFFSCPLDDAHLWAAIRYVELNPVRAGMVVNAEDYSWSSARAHCGRSSDMLLSLGLPGGETPDEWREQLKLADPTAEAAIRSNTLTGRPCGSEAFAIKLEGVLNRRLRPQKAGRKKRIEACNSGLLFDDASKE